ncbi:beta strand repeat-containing protein [Diaminobutyricibacter sp. McL0608]|uniref:beta strand repeat-containing protein n=1 Tax=Leifsonia sp. McL0608 TaxID=3143537 RepID=UPI0031F2F5AC
MQTQRTNADSTSSANGGKTSGSTTAPSASTSDGKVNVAAAIALDLATTVSRATIEGTGITLTSGGLVTLGSSANTDAATSADGSASQGATATIGAAVAITLANVTNQALLPAGDTVHAKALAVSATETVNGADAVSTYGAQATSGAGGGKISVAGSLGLAVINQTTTAEVAGTVVLTGGDANIIAASNAASTVKAEPTPGGVTATNVGVGASVALNLITDTTTATLDDGISLTGAANVTLSSTAGDAAITEAKMGATGGKVDIAPAVAVTLSNVTTTSRVGTLGTAISLTGSFSGSATQNASASSTAGAVVAGGSTAAIGVGVALTIANHTVTATTARSITAGGDIALRASGISASAAAASASASGAPENGASGSGTSGGGGAGNGVDQQVKTQRDNADATSTANGGKTSGSTTSPSASTSDGKVNVAAAVGIDIATILSKATIENAGLTLTAGGLVTLASSANTDAASSADGSASHGATATIGAGVAITLANVTNQAILPVGDTIKAHALTVSATVTPNGADTTSTYGAQSVAGAGQGKISVAGSVAIAIVNQATQAELAGTVTLTGGDVAVTAASNATSTVTAEPTPGGVTATNVGVGASVALNLITDTTNAVLDAGIVVVGAHNFTLTATAGDLATTDAKMGASGGKVDVSPAVAITISNVTTTASIGTLPGNGTITLTGSFSATATQTAGAVTSAGSVATGGSTASVGVALALNLVTHTVSSTTGRNITAAGSISFGAFGSSVDGAAASASASGAPQQGDSNAPSGGVDGQAQKERTNAIGTDTANGGSGSSASANPSASTSDGKVSVAAGVALNIADVSATSILPDGLTLIAGGAVSLRSSENVDGAVKADGTAVKATNVGVGAAVALNLVTITNRSYLGERTHVTSNGFDLRATMTALAADTTHTFTVEADAGAGSKKVGIAGALALNLVTDNTEAYIPGSAVVAAGSGDISLMAQNLRSDSAKALADASIGGGGTVGVGASVAINVLTTNVTRAEVMDGASLTGGRNVTLTATSAEPVVNTVTAGSAGSSVAVSPAVGINIVVNTTLARIGTPGAGTLAATGAVLLSATHSGSASITGDAKAASSSVAVGAIIAVNVLTVTTTAALVRNISGTSVVLTATTTTSGSADVTASAQGSTPGTGGSSDGQAKDSVQNTPSTSGNESRLPTGDQSAGGAVGNANSESGGQSGQSSGQGVGVGAAVSVNVVTDTNTASIADGLTVTASGAIQVSATNATDATAKSVGLSTAINSNNIGAGIGLNVATIVNRGSIGVRTTITGGTIVVQAVTPPQTENDFTVWGLSAAGGAGDVSVAGSVAVQVISFENTALIGAGSKVTATGALVLAASNPMGLQTIAGAGGLSLDGSGVGAAIAVSVLSVDTRAYIDSNIQQPTTVNAGGAISISASASLVPLGISIIPSVKVPDVTSVAVAGGAGTSGVAVGGSFIVDVFNLTTQAFISNNASVNQSALPSPGQSISITASDDVRALELAGSLGLSLGSVGVGISVIVGVINKDVRAYIGHSVVASAGGDVTLRATDPQDFTEIAIGAAASQSVGVTGSIVVLVLNPSDSSPGTRAYIDGGPRQATVVHAGGNVTIQAEDNASNIGLYAGQISVGGSAGVGISSTVLVRSGIVDAWIAGGDDIWAKGQTGLTIGATQNEDVTLIAVGGTVGGSAAVAGSATVDVLNNVTHAHIDRGATINSTNAGASATQGVSLSATDTTTIKGVAGQLAVGGSAGIGAGADVELLNKDTQAWIDPQVSVLANGSVTIDAASSENVISVSAGVSAGGTVGVALNAAVSVFTIVTKAYVGEVCSAQAVNATSCATSRATILAGGSARISANEQLTLNVIAGSIAIGGTVGVGASAAVPIVNKTTTSFIGDNSVVRALGNGAGLVVNTGGYAVSAVDTRFTPSAAIEGDSRTLDLGYNHGFTDGQQVLYDDGGGTPITNLVQGNVYYVHYISPHEVQLSATQGGPIIVLGVPVRGGESQRLMATDHAATPQAPGQYFTPSSDVVGNVINLPYDLTVNTGDPVVYRAGGGTAIGNLVDGQTYYAIVVGPHSIELADSACHANPGGSNCSGAVQTPITLNKATAGTDRAHSILKQGDQPPGDAASVSGQHVIVPNTAPDFHGVSVTANNSDDIGGFGVAAGFGTVGVSVSGSVNVVTANTSAFIGRVAQINVNNAGASSAQSVVVTAGNAFQLLIVAASIAAGAVGVGANAAVGIVTLNTDAVIGTGAVVNAARDVVVASNASDQITAVAAAAAGGAVGVAGVVSVIVLSTHTYADTGLGVAITAGNNVLFSAADATKITVVSGGAAVGAVGVGVGVAVTSLTKDTRAFIGAGSAVDALAQQPGVALAGIDDGTVSGSGFGTLPAFNGLAVQARSSENVFGMAVAAGGGFVGVAGGLNVTLLHATTLAFIDSNALNRTRINLQAGAGSQQSVNVASADKVTTFTIGGGLGVGFVGVAGGIDIGIADITSQAYIGSFATLHAAKDVAFHALAIKNIQTYAVSIGGGFVGVAGSVSVWSVGTAPTGSYNEGSYGQDRGAWSSTATYAQGDVVTGSDGKRYGAKVANPTLDPVADTTGSQWEGSTNALSPSSGKPDAATEAGGHANGSGTGGFTGILDGTSNMHNTSDNTNGRMQPTLGSANTSVHGSAPSSNIVSAEFSNASVPQGTVATVGAGTVIVAGGSVSVDAGENLSVNGLAGTAAGGAVAVGGSVLILGITSNVEAFIQEGASVTAGGNVNVKAVLTESDNGIVFAGVGGVVAVTGQVVLITSHATQNAHIDDGAAIPTAGGAVDVEAIGTRTVSPLAIGGSIGLVAAGASVAVALVDGDTTATIGNVTIGSLAPAGGIVEVARSTIVAPVQAYSVSVGVGGGISGAVAVAAISGTTTALYNGHATLSGGASITANGTNTPTASTLSVATGAFAAGINVAGATTSRTVFARFTSAANVAAGGAVIVGATSRNHASATTPSVTVALIGFSLLLPIATISGATESHLDGVVSASGSIAVTASGQNQATATAFVVGITLVGGGQGTSALAKVAQSADVLASVGPTASLRSFGAVQVTATIASDGTHGNYASATVTSGGGGLISAGLFLASAILAGATTAELRAPVFSSGSITVSAAGDSTANASTTSFGLSGFGVTVALVDAEVQQSAGVVAIVSGGTLTSSGAVKVAATNANRATVSTDAASIGLFTGAANAATAIVAAETRAELADSITSQGLQVTSDATSATSATSKVVSIGLISGAFGDTIAQVTATAGVRALVDASATTVNAGAGDVLLRATSVNSAFSQPSQISVGLFTMAGLSPTASVAAPTRAEFDGGITTSGAFSVTATGHNTATATVKVDNFSIAGATGVIAHADVTASAAIAAVVASSARISAGGQFTVTAQTPGGTSADAEVSSNTGGIISGGIFFAQARIGSPVTASMDGALLASTGAAVSASAANTVTAVANALNISLAGFGAALVDAELLNSAGVTAHYGTGALATSGLASVVASSSATAGASTDTLSVGAIIVGLTFPTARIDAGTSSDFGGTLTGATGLTVQSTATNSAATTAGAQNYGLITVGSSSPVALITGNVVTQANIDAGALLNAPSATVAVVATATNGVTAKGGSVNGGLGTVSSANPAATDTARTFARMLGAAHGATATTPGAASISVQATSGDTSTALISDTSGAGVAISNAGATATTATTVETDFASAGAPIATVGNITIGVASNPVSISSALSTSVGILLNISNNSARVVTNPTVNLTIAAGAQIFAGGTITVSAQQNTTAPPSPNHSDFDGNGGVNTTTDTITLTAQHSFTTGGTVTYTTNGGTAVGGLTNNAQYNVIVVNPNAVQLGSIFDGAHIDPATDTIQFGTQVGSDFIPLSHNLHEGDFVIYIVPNGGSAVPGLVSGHRYRVHVVDASSIQLFDASTPTAPVGASGANVTGGNTISVANTYGNGNAVIYTAPNALHTFTTDQVEIAVDGSNNPIISGNPPAVQFVNDNTITIQNHGFSTGQAVVYEGATDPVGGLVNGQTYFVIVLNGNQLRLAANLCDATGTCLDGSNNPIPVNPITLTPDRSDAGRAVVHGFWTPGQQPILGLDNGARYYIVGASNGGFQLATTPGGAPIALNGTGVVGVGNFTPAPVDLGVGSGPQDLVVDLTSAGSGTQTLSAVGIGGSTAGGGQLSTATVNGSGGGIISSSHANTNASETAVVTVNIGGANTSITALGSVIVTTNSNAGVSADSANGGGGLVAIGSAAAQSSTTTSTTVTVGGGTTITAGADVTIAPVTFGQVQALSQSSAGGLGAGVGSDAGATMNISTITTVAGTIVAGNDLGVSAHTGAFGNVSTSAEGGGLGVDAHAGECGAPGCDLNIGITTTVDLQPGAHLTADNVSVIASVDSVNAHNNAHTHARAVGAASNASANVNVTSNATVHLEHDVKIVGYETVTLKAVHNAITLIASSDAHCGCLGGDTNSTSNIGYNSESNVTADAGSIIRTALLDVEALQLLTNWSRPTNSDGAAFDGGGSHGGTTENARRVISWHATVFLHAADPQLVVDANGTIVKLFAVTVKDDLGNTYGLGQTIPVGRIIEVQDITNTGGAQAIFFANIPDSLAGGSPPAGIITGTDGKFITQNTFDFVKLFNSSSRTMVVHSITVVNLTSVAATITVKVQNSAGFLFAIGPPIFLPTAIDIENFLVSGNGTAQLILDGRIYNPIGSTRIDNQHGDILAGPDSPLVVTNTLVILADNGTIGLLFTGGLFNLRIPIPVVLVQSDYIVDNVDPTRFVSLIADARDDVVLDITSILRGPATTFTPTIPLVHAGRNIDIVLGDSLQGNDLPPFTSTFLQVNVFQPPQFTITVAPTGQYQVFFHPDPAGPFVYTDPVLVAFGTVDLPYPSTYVFQDLSAGNDINVRHTAARAVLNIDAHTNVDATLSGIELPTPFSTTDQAGEIDLFTNGSIIDTETISDLRVGTITSTASDVTLIAQDSSGASIFDVGGITDGSARVTGNTITLIALFGGIGFVAPAVNYLEIHSSNAARGWVLALAADGIYLTQTTGNLFVNLVDSFLGDVALTDLNGSILNNVDGTATTVIGVNIDLIAHNGSIGTASATGVGDLTIDTDAAAGGRLYALADGPGALPGAVTPNGDIYITEATGALNVLRAESVFGDVRLTIPFVTGRTDADLDLLAGGSTLDGATTLTEGRIVALGFVLLRIGDDLESAMTSLIQGATVTILGEYLQNPAAPVGSTMHFAGTVTGQPTDIFGGAGIDTFFFDHTFLGGQTNVYGGPTSVARIPDGNDVFIVDHLQTMSTTHIDASGDVYSGLPVRDSLLLDGETGNNSYVVTTWGSVDPLNHDYLINVLNSGPRGGLNTLTVNGSDGPDVFLLRGASIIPGQPGAALAAFVALLHGVLDAERINYDDHINSRLTVNGLGGNDLFVVDDNSAITTLDGGDGNDRFIIGQLFDIPRTPPAVHPEDQFPTVATKLGLLSDGISFPTTIFGGAGNDTFTVNHNLAELRIEAGTGADKFLITVARLPLTKAYLTDGALSLDGGVGASTVRVTAFDNLGGFVNNINGVTGEGLHVTMHNFAAKAALALFTGAVPTPTPLLLPGEDPPPVVVVPLAVPVAGSGVVTIIESSGGTVVKPGGPLTDTYTIQLSTPPTAPVFITLSAAFGGGAPYAQISIDGGLTFADTAVLEFAAGEVGPKTVIVQLNAGVTSFPPGSVVETISHSSESDDPVYEHAAIRNVYVNQPPAKVVPPPPPPVTPPTTPTTPSATGTGTGTGTGGLADTGSTTSGFGGLAGGLLVLLLGLGLVLLARRGRASAR